MTLFITISLLQKRLHQRKWKYVFECWHSWCREREWYRFQLSNEIHYHTNPDYWDRILITWSWNLKLASTKMLSSLSRDVASTKGTSTSTSTWNYLSSTTQVPTVANRAYYVGGNGGKLPIHWELGGRIFELGGRNFCLAGGICKLVT